MTNALAVQNRYLPAHLKSRAKPLLMLLTMLVFLPLIALAFGLLSMVADVFGLVAVLVLLLDMPVVLLVCIPIFTSLGRLRSLSGAALVGNTDLTLPPAHFALRWVFRGDIRLVAFYTLGLTAESRGDFREAAEAFRCALSSLPMGNVAKARRRVGGLCASHLALCLAALGREHAFEARDALMRAQGFLMIGPGAFDFMFDLNASFTSLSELEPGRDPRAVAALAGAATAYVNGAYREALDILGHEQQAIFYGFLPRERALAAALERRARAALDVGGMLRAAGNVDLRADSPDEAWAGHYLLPS